MTTILPSPRWHRHNHHTYIIIVTSTTTNDVSMMMATISSFPLACLSLMELEFMGLLPTSCPSYHALPSTIIVALPSTTAITTNTATMLTYLPM
jgi:hypothetical protein